MGEQEVDAMLVFSQVLLSMQLAFAVIPLIHFVSDRKRMGIFTIKPIVKIAAWIVASIIVALNLKLVYETAADWIAQTDSTLIKALIVGGELGIVALLIITTVYPFILQHREASVNIHKAPEMDALQGISKPFRKIAMAVDYTDTDRIVMQYAMHLGNADTEYLLIHIVESAQARMLQDKANDYETLQDKAYLDKYIQLFADKSLKAQGILGFKNRKDEIARIVKENNCDLLVLGSHGHKSIKDFIFGETINTLRHKVDIPVFIAQ